jgi:hypothetical protein
MPTTCPGPITLNWGFLRSHHAHPRQTSAFAGQSQANRECLAVKAEAESKEVS